MVGIMGVDKNYAIDILCLMEHMWQFLSIKVLSLSSIYIGGKTDLYIALQCFPCQKLDEATNCGGRVLRDYFTTEEDIVNLKKLCSFGGVVRVRENIERALSLGNSVHEYIATMIKDIDNMRVLQNMKRELRNEVAELRNEVAELRGRVTDDDTHVSNTPDDLDITRMSVSPQGSPDVESPLAGSDKHDG